MSAYVYLKRSRYSTVHTMSDRQTNDFFYYYFICSLQLRDNRKAPNGSGGNRLSQPRMSLLGKPLNLKQNRRDVRYRKLQAKLYNFLERPTGRIAAIYHALV